MGNETTAERLADTGQIYVTQTAAEDFSDATLSRNSTDVDRRRLTELLLDARLGRRRNDDGTEGWHCRADGLDIQAHIAREGELAIVVDVRVSRY